MTDPSREAEVVAMMESLYSEDPAASGTDSSRFPVTVRTLLARPDAGRIVLIETNGELAGYALLIPYWSNEFGGCLLFVDELYIRPPWRGRGLARGLFASLREERPYDAVALALETTAVNLRARGLYESLGFRARSNSVLACVLKPR